MHRGRSPRFGRAPLGLVIGFATFLVAMGYIVATSLVRRSAPTFDATPFGARAARGDRAVDTVTVDARDERAWRFVDLTTGDVRPAPDGAPWDIAVRRYHVIASDAIADLGPAQFDTVRDAPATGWRGNTLASDSTNPAIARWYDYGMMSHLLEPKKHVYAVRSRRGGFAKLAIVSYYCRGLEAGCLTIRFAPIAPARPAGGPSASSDRP